MTSLPGVFTSNTAEVIVAMGVLVFLVFWGGARFLRGWAEVIKARSSPALPPPTPPPIAPASSDLAVIEVEVVEHREVKRHYTEAPRSTRELEPNNSESSEL